VDGDSRFIGGEAMSERFASTPPVAADRAPDAFGGGGHWQIDDAERGEGVEDRVHDGRRRGDGAAFAETFGAEWVRSLYWIADGLHPLLVQLRQMPKPAHAYGRTKALLQATLDDAFDVQLRRETESFAACAATDEFVEGVRAFLESARRISRE
jgi:enoyl-CoA hydratase/carnithine racemase